MDVDATRISAGLVGAVVATLLVLPPARGDSFLSQPTSSIGPGGRDYGSPAWLYHRCARARVFFSSYLTLAGVLVRAGLPCGCLAPRWRTPAACVEPPV